MKMQRYRLNGNVVEKNVRLKPRPSSFSLLYRRTLVLSRYNISSHKHHSINNIGALKSELQSCALIGWNMCRRIFAFMTLRQNETRSSRLYKLAHRQIMMAWLFSRVFILFHLVRLVKEIKIKLLQVCVTTSM